MLQEGVGYTLNNASGGQSLVIDIASRYKETLPFFVYEDTTEGGEPIFRINAGTFNNQFPTVDGFPIGNKNAYIDAPAANGLIVLRIQASDAAFPASTPQIIFSAGFSVPGNGEEQANVAIAKIEVKTEAGQVSYTVSNLVSGSLWGERFKCGSELEYWFSRI